GRDAPDRATVLWHRRRRAAARALAARHRVYIPRSRGDAPDRARCAAARAKRHAALVRAAAARGHRRGIVSGIPRAHERGRVESAGRRRQPAGHLLRVHLRSPPQVARRPRAAVVPRNDSRSSPAGRDRAGARRFDSGDRPLFLVAGHGRRVGRVLRAAGRRDGPLQLGNRALRDARGHHALGDAARRRHRHSHARLDARAGDRLHPRAHARAAAARRGRGGSLSGVAGAGAVVRPRASRNLAPARARRAQAEGSVRHPRISRPGPGEWRGAAAGPARRDRTLARRLALVLALIPAALLAQRESVLRQVDVPHAYYWREMYVPQVTSGPSAATWAPDGTELIYSMDGTLWRQRIGVGVARQLTSGPAYDYQPDWSPDGRTVVFARYARDAIELQLLDLQSGKVTPLTANGAVNVEPRWSPDGTRIAFVSTAYNRRWHVFILSRVATKDLLFGEPTRLTEDNDSKLPRYYYSRWDHYISPAWSPDGKELVLISNRGHIHGAGGFWRMDARPGAPLREIRYEETTWKARPDWSPDGTRIVYSSYLGRQWNQLWIMPSEGGDPFPLTYGDFDAT